MNRKILVIIFVLALASSVAGVPDLSVSPNKIDRTGNQSLLAGQVNEVNLTFSNEDQEETIYDVSPGSGGLETDYISFSNNSFNIGPNSSKTVRAEIFTEEPKSFNDSTSVIYSYNTSDGLESNSSRFPEVNFSVETRYERTNISLNVLTQSFEEGFGNYSNSTFDLENTGSETAHDINISGQDVVFDRNGFDVSESDHSLVDFSVKIPLPEENRTNMTNRTYVREVNVSGSNFESKSFEVEVFVPYKDYSESIPEEDRIKDAVEEISSICKEYPKVCEGDLVRYRNNTEYINNTPVYNANLTQEQLSEIGNISGEYAQKIESQKKRINVLQQNIRELKDSVNGDLSSLNQTQRQRYNRIVEEMEERNQLKNETNQIEQQRSNFNKTVVIGASGIVFISLAVLGTIKGFRMVQGDEMEEFVA